MAKITFRQVQKAVLAADDAKGAGYDVRANQFSASFGRMFEFLAKKDVDHLVACEKNPELEQGESLPGIVFLYDTLMKYVKDEIKRRARAEKERAKEAANVTE